jgi:LETM1 and EF-hand domain-containing protein 1
MIKKIDGQLEKYDEKVGSSLNIIHTNAKGQISLKDLETAFRAIKHAPDEEMVEKLGEKLDVDKDGFVVSQLTHSCVLRADDQELDHVVDLAQERDFGIGLEEEAKDILGQGKDIRTSKELKELRCVFPLRSCVLTDNLGLSEKTSWPTRSRKSIHC